MEVRFLINSKKHAVRRDLISVPKEGDIVILKDDNDYKVISVAWDLFDVNSSAAVVDLKPVEE